MRKYRIEFRDKSRNARTVLAAGFAVSPSFPGMLVFHDDAGTETLMVDRDQLLTVERLGEPKVEAPGFQPTTQLMSGRGRPPE